MDMQSVSAVTVSRRAPAAGADRPLDTVETQLWLDEHEWLHALLKSAHNVSPTFRFPDLISACVALVLGESGGADRLFRYLGKELVLRDPRTPRRREYLWREQFDQLRELQMSQANRHPNPMFQLDQLTTACVALARRSDDAAARVLRQARLNMAKRTGCEPVPVPSG